MMKLWTKTIAMPLSLIFRSILDEVVVPDDWEKDNLVPVHKRHSKNLIKNEQSMSFPYFQ